MTKLETWNAVQELLETHKGSKKLGNALEELLAPKNGGGKSTNPPKLDENGNIVEAYCRFHERYEPVEDMVLSKGKSKGYCRASISKWNKLNATIKKMQAEVSTLMDEDKLEEAQQVNNSIKIHKSNLNDPAYYDYDQDYLDFKGE